MRRSETKRTTHENDNYTIAMARTPIRTRPRPSFHQRGRQRFSQLYGGHAPGWGYCVFGRVTAGTEVVDRIKKVRTGSRGMHQDVPYEDVIIERAEVV